MAAAVYNTYHPASDQSVSNTLESWWLQISYDTGFILVREFWPDVVRKFRRHPSATGRNQEGGSYTRPEGW
jgi:hypothetical protein